MMQQDGWRRGRVDVGVVVAKEGWMGCDGMGWRVGGSAGLNLAGWRFLVLLPRNEGIPAPPRIRQCAGVDALRCAALRFVRASRGGGRGVRGEEYPESAATMVVVSKERCGCAGVAGGLTGVAGMRGVLWTKHAHRGR